MNEVLNKQGKLITYNSLGPIGSRIIACIPSAKRGTSVIMLIAPAIDDGIDDNTASNVPENARTENIIAPAAYAILEAIPVIIIKVAEPA